MKGAQVQVEGLRDVTKVVICSHLDIEVKYGARTGYKLQRNQDVFTVSDDRNISKWLRGRTSRNCIETDCAEDTRNRRKCQGRLDAVRAGEETGAKATQTNGRAAPSAGAW